MSKTLDEIILFISGVILGAGLFMLALDNAEAGQNEAWYVERACNQFNGVQEYKNTDGTRTDCLTNGYSMEFDFAKKWYECITQAQYYALLNGNRPACVLIVEDPARDEKYFDRARFYKTETCSPVEIIVINKKDIEDEL